jgi:hypothetical protein
MNRDSIADTSELLNRLAAIDGTRGMWKILLGIYDIAGWSHALATLRGWGWKG